MPDINGSRSGDEMDVGVSISDIAELLFQQFVIISGGKSKERCPIITFPDNGIFYTLSDDDYKRLISYITAVPSLHEADNGFVLIVDRRNDKWSSVKHVLFKFTEFFPGLIHVVYVIRPIGILQKAISEVSNKFFRDDFKFKVILCNGVEELHQYIEKSELSADLNGILGYQHEVWIQQRISLETFSLQMKSISNLLDDFTQYVRTSFDLLPVTFHDAQDLLKEHSTKYEILKEKIKTSSAKGEAVLHDMKQGSPSSQLPPSAINNISAVERLLVQLDETDKIFDAFWKHHSSQLEKRVQLQSFETEFENEKRKLVECLETINKMADTNESAEHVDSLVEELNEFHNTCQTEIDKSEELMRRGNELMDNQQFNDVGQIESKCEELRQINQSLAEKLLQRIDLLKKARSFQIRIQKANRWCSEGIELLGSHNIEKCSMFPEKVEQILSEMEHFVASADVFNVSGTDDLYVLCQYSPTSEMKAVVTQVLQRIEDVTVMCEKWITHLRRLMVKSNKPVQSVTPEVVLTKTSGYSENGETVPEKTISSGIEEWQCKKENRISDSYVIEFMNLPSKQQHILKELLDTERVYVTEMKNILTGYKYKMNDENMKHLIPDELRGKEDVLFCNLDELCSFHGDKVLPELSSYIFDVGKVAELFLKQKDEFLKLYSFYCQNVIKSDKLRDQVGEKNEFFLTCQANLSHKLPLTAYMLKPVQRITKYQLLLRDLMNNTDNETQLDKLQQALNCMLLVIKCVNDRMHSISITGLREYDISEQGEMLLQASFNIWVENKKDLLKELRLKPLRRHIFLFRKSMIFCKKSSTHNQCEYLFKGLLKMSKIGLTETVRGDNKKFEIWLEGRQEIYMIQAATIEQKKLWVKEIKKVLFEQLTELKGEKLRQYGDKWQYRTISLETATSGYNSQGISRPNSHHEVSDDSSTSSLNSDDEDSVSSNPTINGKFVALADYCASAENQVSLKEGDKLELLKISAAGWWYVKLISCGTEGWVPVSYLEPQEGRKSVRRVASSNSQQSCGSQYSTDPTE